MVRFQHFFYFWLTDKLRKRQKQTLSRHYSLHICCHTTLWNLNVHNFSFYDSHSTQRQTLISFRCFKFEVFLTSGFTFSLIIFSKSCWRQSWLRYLVSSPAERLAQHWTDNASLNEPPRVIHKINGTAYPCHFVISIRVLVFHFSDMCQMGERFLRFFCAKMWYSSRRRSIAIPVRNLCR